MLPVILSNGWANANRPDAYSFACLMSGHMPLHLEGYRLYERERDGLAT